MIIFDKLFAFECKDFVTIMKTQTKVWKFQVTFAIMELSDNKV